MTQRDVVGLIVLYVYAFSLLGIAEGIRAWRHYPQDFTRKIVHIGAGMAVFPILALFDSWYWGIVPTFTFIFFNYIAWRFKLLGAMDADDSTPGTVYFAFSVTLLLACFWPRGQAYVAVAGIMAMTWGDAFAAIIGRRWGQHRYLIQNNFRSLEGSAAMAGFSFVTVLLTLAFASGLAWYQSLLYALIIALATTAIEAVSIIGLDNIAVPIGGSFVLLALVTWPVDNARLALGLGISTLIGVFAYSRRSLSLSGVIGAMATGTTIFAFGGWSWGLLLIVFFVCGTALSKYKERQKSVVAADKFDKGSRRDLGQVLANAGIASIVAVLYALAPAGWLYAVFVGLMATVNADTTATEIGVLSKRPPRLITSGKIVVPGTSGGITTLGTLAATGGGLVIGLAIFAFRGIGAALHSTAWQPGNDAWLIVAGAVGGLVGALADSLLGATLQAMYWCPRDNKETEKRVHGCGTKTEFRRGLVWMDNDAVNFVSSIAGAAAAVGIAALFGAL